MAEFQKVISEWKRMCEMLGRIGCFECPLGDVEKRPCSRWVKYHPEEAERIIMQWAKEHPIKTNRMRFEEVFGCGIVTHKINEAIPGHVKILNASDEEFEEWLNSEYKGGQNNA